MAEPPQTANAWRRMPRPLRWLAILVGVLVVVVLLLALGLRLATNRWIRPVVEEQASIAIPGEVSLGGLHVSLLGLSVTVDDLAIRPESPPDAKPVVAVGRLYVSLAHLPLLAGRVVVNEIDIERPVVRVVREQSGEIDLLKVLVPETPPPPAEPAPPSKPIPVRLSRIDLGEGRVEFEDEAKPGAQPIVIEIPHSRIDDVVVAGEPGKDHSKLSVEVSAEGATVRVDGSFYRAGDQLQVDATVDARKVPLARARLYLPDLGWSALGGEVDANLHYLQDSGKQESASGTVQVRGFEIDVPNLKEPALSFGTLDVAIDQLDLLGRSLALGDVKLDKLRVVFDPANRSQVPLLPKGLPAASTEPTPPSDTKPFSWAVGSVEVTGAELVPIGKGLEPLGLDAGVQAISSTPGSTADVRVKLTQGKGAIELAGKACPTPVGFRGKLGIEDLALGPLVSVAAPEQGALVADGLAKGALEIRLGSLAAGETPAPGGDLQVAGTLGVSQLDAKSDAEGSLAARVQKVDLAIQSLDLPGLLPARSGDGAPVPPPADAGTLRLAATLGIGGVVVRSGRGDPLSATLRSLDLAVKSLELPGMIPPATDAAPPEGAGRLRVAGAFDLSGLAVKSGREEEFSLDLDKLELGVRQVEVPGLLGVAGRKPAPEPLRVALERLRLAAPKLRLTRTDTGLVLPEPPGARPAADKTPAEKSEASAAKAPASASPAFRLELASLAIENGSARLVDRTVKPFYQGDVTHLALTARDLSFPDPQVRDVSLKLDAPGPAPLWAFGAYDATSSWFELNLDKLPLAPLNPYIRSASGYIVNGGELSLYTKGSRSGDHIYVENWLTLFDPDITGGGPDAPLEKAVGAPVSLIVSLLKDPTGKISLTIPIDYDRSGASVRLGSVIGSAVTQVLLGALTSPLKLLGAVVDTSGKVKDATPEPIHFAPGRIDLAAGDDERVASLARLAAARPGLVLQLSGQTSGTDGQFLREAKLLQEIDSGEGLPEQARGLGNVLARRRLHTALEARLAGEAVTLEPEDSQRLDDWLAAVEVGPDALTDLARKRAARVQELLQTRFGLDAKQIRQVDPGPPGASPLPAVDVSIGS